MKSFMKLFFQSFCLSILISVVLVSCQAPIIQPSLTEITAEDLPQQAREFISTYYDLADIFQANHYVRDSGEDLFESSLLWGTDLYFSEDGTFIGSRDDDNGNDHYLSLDQIPQNILDYVMANYQAEIQEAEKNHHPDGSFSFEIELRDGLELYFDQSGVFFHEDKSGGKWNGSGSHVPISSLPLEITTYIQNNFPGTTIVKAEKKLNQDGSFRKFEIELNNGIELYFSENGERLIDDSSSSNGFDDSINIPVSDLPQVIKSYISTNFPGLQIDRAKKKLNDDGSIRNYEVRLSDSTKVFFDANGNFTGSDD